MNLKTLSLVVAGLAAISGIVWFAKRPAPPRDQDARVGQPLVDAALIEKATLLRISQDGQDTELRREADGTWRVANYHDLPADFAKLARFVDELRQAKIDQFVTATPERITRLGFAGNRVEFLASAGQSPALATFTFGKTAEAGGRFVRFGDEPRGYRTAATLYLDATAKNWADSTLLSLKSDEIARLELSFPTGQSVTAQRETKDKPWASADAPAGQRLKADALASTLANLTSIRFTDTTALDDESAVAARRHARTIRLTTFTGTTYTISLARKPEEKKSKATATTPPVSENGPAPQPEPAEKNSVSPAETGGAPEPTFDTIPAGPVFVEIKSSDDDAPVNRLMAKRAFQLPEWSLTSLPATPESLWEPTPANTPATAPAK